MRRKGKGMYDYRKDKKGYIAKQRAKKVILFVSTAALVVFMIISQQAGLFNG